MARIGKIGGKFRRENLIGTDFGDTTPLQMILISLENASMENQ